jgi:hypothetical protein
MTVEKREGDAMRRAVLLVGVIATMICGMAAAQSRSSAKTSASLATTLETIERAHWDAYKRVDVAFHNAILTEDYTAVAPDGVIRRGKPTAQEIAGTPIGAYAFEDFRVASLAPAVALVTFVANVEVPGAPSRFRFAVCEIWIQKRGKWFQRFYQATLLK